MNPIDYLTKYLEEELNQDHDIAKKHAERIIQDIKNIIKSFSRYVNSKDEGYKQGVSEIMELLES